MKLSHKIGTGIASASLLALSIAPIAFADTGVDVAGNGAFSDNKVKVNNNDSTKLNQTNNTNITNDVTTRQNTGNNNANFNTGGSVTILTGDANASTKINNQAGSNKAVVDGAGSGSTYVNEVGNGAFSDNKVKVNNNDQTRVSQTNNTDFTNRVNTYQNTGNNNASFNTGTHVVIATGDANADTQINNQAGQNFATVYNGKGSNDNWVDIAGNGAFSDNRVKLNNNDNTSVKQTNNTSIYNDVYTRQNTGKNNASFNTGGAVLIRTGDANANTAINNQAGQNYATVYNDGGNGWGRGTDVNIVGNGAFSSNKVRVNDNSYDKVKQKNNTRIYNYVDTYQNTGKNYADFNTYVPFFIDHNDGYNKPLINVYDGEHDIKGYVVHPKFGQKDGYKWGGFTGIVTGKAYSWTKINNEAGQNAAYVI